VKHGDATFSWVMAGLVHSASSDSNPRHESGGGVWATPLPRIAWLICMVIFVPAAAIGLTTVVRRPEIVSSAAFLELMDRIGVSTVVATWVGFVLPTVCAFIVAIVIRRGRPGDPPALLFGLSVISLFLIVAGVGPALSTVIPRPAARVVEILAGVLVVLGLYLFPKGRFEPRWIRWVALVLILACLIFPDLVGAARGMGTDTADMFPPGLRRIADAAAVLVLATWLPNQIYLYRRRSSLLERLQTRWVLFGFALILIGSSCAILLRAIGTPASWAVWPLVAGAVGSLVLPVAAGFAILRYRLYEIDRIISRTIAYTILVGTLAGLYAVAVFAMTALVPITSDLAVAGSTLAVATLFNPLRRRIQQVVDRRFNRPRYDGTLLIDSFAAKLSSRAELSEVVSELGGVLMHTVEPSSTMIWLRGVSHP
jgi:hypothetical protein